MNVQQAIDQITNQMADLSKRILWLNKHRDKLNECDVYGNFWNGVLDFDFASHPNVVKVIKTFGGKWDKELVRNAENPRINYTTEFDGVVIRCYQGEPPPSCKIVEVEEDVPAVPAGKKIVRKLVCLEAQEAATETASQPATPESNEVPA